MKQARQAVKQTKNILYSNTKISITVAAQSGQRIKKSVIPRVLKTRGLNLDRFPSVAVLPATLRDLQRNVLHD
jgi:hypothetical protein